jgi:hypothetical protein
MNGAMKDLRIFEIQNWWIVARDREIHEIKFYWKPRFIVGCSDTEGEDDKEIVFKKLIFMCLITICHIPEDKILISHQFDS